MILLDRVESHIEEVFLFCLFGAYPITITVQSKERQTLTMQHFVAERWKRTFDTCGIKNTQNIRDLFSVENEAILDDEIVMLAGVNRDMLATVRIPLGARRKEAKFYREPSVLPEAFQELIKPVVRSPYDIPCCRAFAICEIGAIEQLRCRLGPKTLSADTFANTPQNRTAQCMSLLTNTSSKEESSKSRLLLRTTITRNDLLLASLDGFVKNFSQMRTRTIKRNSCDSPTRRAIFL